ncbi:MAG TPA: aminotransferase class V-fold PLP-dependent enzyme [Cyclobacteriaceae bacterium]|nr:aminotransferase class V-fold PLP-dependent enzyme [Cyclobacteriaceae bacterium]MCB9237764.1 aminotransferase class V-fold PLP-dependent enzyme [Flammeovirgaceae bacterium]MCB0498724.1 aminotransferase class V-fold PLP-dependent enzyme [Cyclobacteriaceae bacterium]MCO5270135.1 aminotransferase class V-fold PLP-dependent enzyme [Cyclobacteriaceae bacterium]MCW5903125.1 aminotransferase class V-fold PLP-dependent enzyme [Cyclobacteriaceae bacterium]
MLSLQRSKFSLPAGTTYLNCAYMSPMLKRVEKAGVAGIKGKRNPLGISPKEFFATGEMIRQQFAKLVGCKDPKRIAIVPSVSYGMANAAHNIKLSPREKVLVMGEQFPSNYYPWQRLCLDHGARLETVAPPPTNTGRGKIWNERVLDAIDKDTRVVAMGNVHWADGTLFNLKEIRKRTLEVGALLLVDATQSVGALPFNLPGIQPDALVCAGYKWMMGPYSIGLAYYGPYFDKGKPIEENWINRLNSEDFAGLVNYETAYQPGALRYEVGEHSNFILAPMMLEALRQVNEWKPRNIQAYCAHISRKPVQWLRENGFWIEDDKHRSSHLFGVRLPGHKDIKKTKARLKEKNISVSYRGDAIRVSPHLYNREKELMDFAKVLIG